MIIEYNGVRLDLVNLDRVQRTLVYDPSHTDLLYVEWIITCSCVYSPNGLPRATATTTGEKDPPAASVNYSAFPGLVPSNIRAPELDRDVPQVSNRTVPIFQGGAAEDPGFITDTNLQIALNQNRKKLRIGWPSRTSSGGENIRWWLVSPRDGREVDCCTGPTVIAADVLEAHGEGQTFGVNLQIRTCLPATKEDLLILSHRWVMTHVHDDNYYLTRMIEGTIIFNAAEIQASGVQPDWLRNQFFHPIPLGFQRKLDPVQLSDDGCTIRYTIRDVDQTVTFDPGDSGATQIEVQENVEYYVPTGAVLLRNPNIRAGVKAAGRAGQLLGLPGAGITGFFD